MNYKKFEKIKNKQENRVRLLLECPFCNKTYDSLNVSEYTKEASQKWKYVIVVGICDCDNPMAFIQEVKKFKGALFLTMKSIDIAKADMLLQREEAIFGCVDTYPNQSGPNFYFLKNEIDLEGVLLG